MQPMTLQVAIAVQQEIEARVSKTDSLRRKHVERAQYEAELARRRFTKVDPENRLVADTLEAEWNNKLSSLAEAQEQYERQTQKQRMLIDVQAKEQLLSLAADFPRVWNDPAVEPRERKRILRLLIEDVTLINGEMIQVHVRLRGGALPRGRLHRPRLTDLAADRLRLGLCAAARLSGVARHFPRGVNRQCDNRRISIHVARDCRRQHT